MKNSNYTILILLMIFLVSAQSMIAQVCNDYINVSLANTGTAKIYAENVLEGDVTDYTNLSWDFLEFDCSDIGENDYTISGLYQGNSFSCGGVINIEDKLGPVAICDLGVVVTLESTTDTVWLSPDMVSSTSYDNCSDITSSISPLYVTVADVGQLVTAVVTIVDEAGNTASCWTQILVQGDEGSQFLSCVGISSVLVSDQDVQLYAEDFLVSDFTGTVTMTIVDESQNEVPDNIVTSDYIGQSLIYTLTDPLTGNTCWGTINVFEGSTTLSLACNDQPTVYVSDSDEVTLYAEDLIEGVYTNPVSLYIEDANQDSIENNTITVDYVDQILYYTITDLVNGNICWGTINVVSSGAIELACNDVVDLSLAVDESFTLSLNELLLRGNPIGQSFILYVNGEELDSHELTEEMIGQVITYELIDAAGVSACGGSITLEACGVDYDTFVVCDTKSRSTIINDCISGHTSSDNVEWPTNLELSFKEVIISNDLSNYTDTYALSANDNVDFRDVEPRIIGGCFAIEVTYEDIIIELEDGYKIIRTWYLLDWVTANIYNYNQIIKIDAAIAANVSDLDGSSIAILSNPVINNIQFVDPVDMTANYQIVSMSGQQLDSGSMQQSIDVSQMHSGLYILKVSTLTESEVIKFEILR